MILHFPDMIALVAAWLWPFVRLAAFVGAAPIFGHRPVPVRVRVSLALALTLVVAPGLPPMPAVDPISFTGFLITAQQVLIGLALGFAMRLVFIVLEIGGQQIAQLMGLGFASLVDPANGIEVPVVSNFYIMLGTLVFLALDGHLVVVHILASSFVTLPVDTTGITREVLWQLSGNAGWIFSSAVLMMLPAVVALISVNLGFGVMSRAAPQLNIFAVGFPVTMLFGFVVMALTLPGVFGMFEGLFGRSLSMARLVAAGG